MNLLADFTLIWQGHGSHKILKSFKLHKDRHPAIGEETRECSQWDKAAWASCLVQHQSIRGEQGRCKILSWGKSQIWSLSLSRHQGVLPSVKASLHVGSLLGNNVLMMKEMSHKCWAFIGLYSSLDSLKSNKHLHSHSAVRLKESGSVSSGVRGMLCLSPALWVSFGWFFKL